MKIMDLSNCVLFRMNLTRLTATILLLIFLMINFGCAAVMASRQPGYTDLNVLRQGTSRGEIIAALGPPITSEKDKNGNLVEHYQFKQGYKTGTKVLRVIFHIAADVVTLFLWEIVGMPIEMTFDGNQTTVTTTYDEGNQLQKSTVRVK